MSQLGTAVEARLKAIAAADDHLQPYVSMLSVALRAAEDPVWEGSLAWDAQSRLAAAQPALSGGKLSLPAIAAQTLIQELIEASGQPIELPHPMELRQLLEASLNLDHLKTDDDSLMPILELALFPRLQALTRSCQPALQAITWQAGFCPVCAAWPVLAESHGLERTRVLRCGRCGTGWSLRWQLCPFCGNDNHARLGHFFDERRGEARRVSTCDICRGYLKTFATVVSMEPGAVLLEDLASLELDLAALDQDYRRPALAPMKLSAQVQWS